MSTSAELQGNNPIAQNTYDILLDSVKEMVGYINADFRNQSEKHTRSDLRNLWSVVIQTAMTTPTNDDQAQDSLVKEVRRLGRSGSLRSDATPENGFLWYSYPLLAEHVSDTWLDGWKWFKKEDTLNLAAFTSRLVEAHEHGPKLLFCALLVLRETLETRRRLNVKEDGTETPVADLFPAAMAWFRIAGEKIANYCLDTVTIADEKDETEAKLAAVGHVAANAGVSYPGFSPERWHFWEERLEMLSSVDDKEINEQAKKGKEFMDEARNDSWNERSPV